MENTPYFAPNCRGGEHREVIHHHRFEAVMKKPCDCPCHGTNGPWWSEARSA